MKKTLLFLTFILCTIAVWSQSRTITGRVNADGEGLPGVTISLKNTSIGTITDMDGSFSINIPSDTPSPLLIFSYLGFESQEIAVRTENYLLVELKAETKLMDEVVVVAYGVQKKSDLSSAIAVVDAEALSKIPVTSVAQAIQGKMAGVTVVNSGSPGSGGSIRIRGVGTVNSTEPLTVVDGIPGAPMPDANDIESLQVLKDAAACALYGARGSNGVILISTKKGKKGKTSIKYNGYYGWQWMHKKLDMLSAEEYVQYHQENLTIGNLGGDFANGWVTLSTRIQQAIDNPSSITRTDWQDELYETAAMTKHNVSVSGGSDNSTFFLSGSYVHQDGIQQTSNFEAINLQVNMSTQLGIFRIGENLNLYSKKSKNIDGVDILRQSPLVPLYNSENLGGYDGATDAMDYINLSNSIAALNTAPSKTTNEGFSGNVFVELDLFKDFTFRSNLAGRLNYAKSTSKSLSAVYGTVNRPNTTMTKGWTRRFNSAFENTLTYRKTIQRHNINALVGYTRETSLYENTNATGDSFTVRDPYSFNTITSNAGKTLAGGYTETTMESILGRVMYDYEGKYLFTGNFRRDGSSKFGKNNRYGNFPSFSAGWRLSEESFMKSTSSFLDNLKLRVSWGIIGSDFGVSAYNQDFSLSQSLRYVFNDQIAPSTTISSIVNEDLRWEEQTTTDIGVDIDLFGNRLSIVADYFYKKTDGMLISVPIPYSNGVSSMLMNAGDVENKGFELTLTGRKVRGEFLFDANFNITFEKNKILKLGNVNQPIIGGVTDQFRDGITQSEVGHSIGEFYGYKMLGIYQIGDTDIPEGAAPGDIRFDDMVDGIPGLTADDRTYIGSPFPDFTYNFGFNASYKNIDFSIFFQGVQGNSIFNVNTYNLEGMKDFHNQTTNVLNRWTPSNPSNTVPRAAQNTSYNLRVSDRFVENGSYLRLKTVSIGYTIPQHLTSKWYIQKLRIYATGQNLLTFTKYSGTDPEISNGAGYSWQRDNNLYNGIDRENYPVSASAFVGVEISF